MTSIMRFDEWENSTSTKSVSIDQIAGGSGLVPIVPTSVTITTGTGSANSMGLVSFTGATAVGLNGIFSSEFSHYRILLQTTASINTGLAFRLMSNGVNEQGANYNRNGVFQRGTSAEGPLGYENQNQGSINIIQDTHPNHTVMDVFSPFESLRTSVLFTSDGFESTGRLFYGGSIRHSLTNSYDGITFFNGSGTFFGNIRVFGYR